MSEVLLYGNINSYSASQFITNYKALGSKEKTVNINGDGGEVKYGWGILTHLSKDPNVNLMNDGEANSMMAFAFCYPAKSKKCSDYSTFGFHRAGYSEWFERDPELFDDATKAELKQKNDKLRAAMEGTIDPIKFMQITKCSLDELFSMYGRKEVIVNAEDALALGLVDEVIQVTPEKRQQISAVREAIEAKFSSPHKVAADNIQTQIPKKMAKQTLAELKADNIELFNEIVNAERERCEAWAVFADVDHKVVAEGISGGKHISAKIQAEFIRKQISAETVAKVETTNIEEIKITADAAKQVPETDAQKTQKAAVEAVRKSLNLS